MTLKDTLKKLTEAYGPSGEEKEVSSLIIGMVKDNADDIFEDNLGNLFVVKKGKGPKVMISAHMDEIGIIVTHIDENGFLRIAPVGGISPRLLVGQRLRFNSGLIGTVYHEKLKELKELDWSKIYLDIGAENLESATKSVKIGDLACLDQPFKEQREGRYMAKSMDDRAGCAVLVEVINRLNGELPQEACFVFSVQEELGLRGAKTAAYRYEPDFGLAVDVTLVGDTPKAPTMAVSLGKGPAIKVKDSSVLCHPAVRRFMIDIADENCIPYQLEVLTRGGTDAGAIHLTREGVPSGAISIPCRYVHTASEVVDKIDLDYAVTLLEKLLLSTWPGTEGLYSR
ncbi:MAG: M42 family metallopeptidase [Bacillota bacterium]|nr:M42 family metallopeptidase [Bacillota bacterium]MDW7728668.1 M42 family metallopeptidase [Bacillota bacterium]